MIPLVLFGMGWPNRAGSCCKLRLSLLYPTSFIFWPLSVLFVVPPTSQRQENFTDKDFFPFFFLNLMKLSLFPQNTPFIHSHCHIHFTHLYVLRELVPPLYALYFIRLCGHIIFSRTSACCLMKYFALSLALYAYLILLLALCIEMNNLIIWERNCILRA
ncbi:hypothetical protein BC943DRAFT_17319 [Umbelopsis sp. AD052]|nr:hypothetical protein BC943DRAFT_17319 [Umbelopsis sp. AD052]